MSRHDALTTDYQSHWNPDDYGDGGSARAARTGRIHDGLWRESPRHYKGRSCQHCHGTNEQSVHRSFHEPHCEQQPQQRYVGTNNSCCTATCAVITVNALCALGWTLALVWILYVVRVEQYLEEKASHASSSYWNHNYNSNYNHRWTQSDDALTVDTSDASDWSFSSWANYLYEYWNTDRDANSTTGSYNDNGSESWSNGTTWAPSYSSDDSWWWWPTATGASSDSTASPPSHGTASPILHISAHVLGVVGAMHAVWYLVSVAALSLVWTWIQSAVHGAIVTIFVASACVYPHVVWLHQYYRRDTLECARADATAEPCTHYGNRGVGYG